MKRTTWLLLALTVASPGCLNLPAAKDDVRTRPPAEAKAAPPPPPAVLPDQVNETNVAQKVRELRAELDYASNESPLTAELPPPAEKPKK